MQLDDPESELLCVTIDAFIFHHEILLVVANSEPIFRFIQYKFVSH
jgi:hypothetical protein